MKYFLYEQDILNSSEKILGTVPSEMSKITVVIVLDNTSENQDCTSTIRIVDKDGNVIRYSDIYLQKYNDVIFQERNLPGGTTVYATCSLDGYVNMTTFMNVDKDTREDNVIYKPQITSPIENASVKTSDIHVVTSSFTMKSGHDTPSKTQYILTEYSTGQNPVLSETITYSNDYILTNNTDALTNGGYYYLFVRYQGALGEWSDYSYPIRIKLTRSFTFRTVIDTTLGGSLTFNGGIDIPTNFPFTININWGDGTNNDYSPGNLISHTYTANNVYTVTYTSPGLPPISSNFITKILDPFPPIYEGNTLKTSGFVLNQCSHLANIPEKLFENNYQMTSLDNCFKNLVNLTVLPDKLFYGMVNLGNCNSTFFGLNISEIPEDLFNYSESLLSIQSCFESTSVTVLSEKLFKNNKNLVNCQAAFKNTKLIELPELLFRYSPNINNVSYLFYGCTGIKEIPKYLFYYNIKILTISYCFYGCNSLITVPVELFNKSTVINDISYCFSRCQSLESLPSDLFSTNEYVTNANSCFEGCSALALIPENLFNKFAGSCTFDKTFKDCGNLLSVSAKVFPSSATELTDTFYNCSRLSTVSPEAFQGCYNITTFRNCFYNCSKLYLIASDLFNNCSSVTSFESTFQNSGLQSIPSNIFRYNTNAINFKNCFNSCDFGNFSLPAIFDTNVKATDFSYCFYNSNLNGIAQDIFKFNVNVISFEGTFGYCRFNEIPNDLFRYATKATNFAGVLKRNNNNYPINTIPNNIFNYNLAATNFSSCFNGLNISDGIIPDNLFVNNTKAYNFSYAFYNCINSYYTDKVFGVISNFSSNLNQFDFSYCFYGTGSNSTGNSTAPELWSVTYTQSPITTNCFSNSNKITNYSNIPNNWK